MNVNLMNYTKDQLLHLGATYGLNLNKRDCKSDIAKTLQYRFEEQEIDRRPPSVRDNSEEKDRLAKEQQRALKEQQRAIEVAAAFQERLAKEQQRRLAKEQQRAIEVAAALKEEQERLAKEQQLALKEQQRALEEQQRAIELAAALERAANQKLQALATEKEKLKQSRLQQLRNAEAEAAAKQKVAEVAAKQKVAEESEARARVIAEEEKKAAVLKEQQRLALEKKEMRIKRLVDGPFNTRTPLKVAPLKVEQREELRPPPPKEPSPNTIKAEAEQREELRKKERTRPPPPKEPSPNTIKAEAEQKAAAESKLQRLNAKPLLEQLQGGVILKKTPPRDKKATHTRFDETTGVSSSAILLAKATQRRKFIGNDESDNLDVTSSEWDE